MVNTKLASTAPKLDGEQRPKRIGLILVHGIGEQQEGDTIDKLRKSLKRIAAEGVSELWIDNTEDGTLMFGFKDISVRVYEVTWSKILSSLDYGAFEIQMLSEVVWFPLISRWYETGRVPLSPSTLFVLCKTVMLSLAVGLIELAHWALTTPLGLWQELQMIRTRFSADIYSDLDLVWKEPTMENLTKAGLIPRRSIVSRLLDQYLGDIFAYTSSAISLLRAPESVEARPVRDILGCVDEAVQRALSLEEGCDEIHILAHSLGTVISYHYLAGLDRAESSLRQRIPVTGFHTIGSPLEKIRHYWPPLALEPASESVRATSLSWSNFINPMDVVSDRIRHDRPWNSVCNRWVLQGGVVRSHTLYEQNSRFLGYLTQSLFGENIRGRRHPLLFLAGVLNALIEAVLVVVGFTALLTLGLFVFAVIFMAGIAGVWLYAELLRLVGWDVLGAEIQHYAFWINLGLFGLLLVLRKIIVEPRESLERYAQLVSPRPSSTPTGSMPASSEPRNDVS